ncbi:phage portal protein [Bradyrhizobium sp. AUGA SZCCT0158]|uniref:phage portal protein n=1 Tax=Bradyrhizobium sp. AUGA SZCCT0158 TaxID=2807661 RepID=UPI001BAE04BA|nr:phage portal protein [Bradyrhizobium sp. AUGA SZCCT0158]MBR1198836.1 phage portal protein [Bradyrhizobium sp. AUGA SZCCT0158]
MQDLPNPWLASQPAQICAGSSSVAVIEPRRVSVSARPEVETSYAAASLNAKDMSSWNPWRVSPDAALLGELDTINARGDDLARNNGVAAGAERTYVDNVIGPRVVCKPNPDRVALKKDATWVDGWSREVEAEWKGFADGVYFDAAARSNFHGATRLQAATLASAGEILALPLWLTDRGSRWNTCLQLVDPARLSNPNGKSDSATLRGGIEIDAYGAPVAYNIRKSHPGDLFGFGGTPFSGVWERIPAWTDFGRARVIHAFEPNRIGQNRGRPPIAPVARMFKMYDHLTVEKLRSTVLNAMIFAAMETPMDQESFVTTFGGDKMADYHTALNEWRVQMKGGAIIPLPPGTKLNPFIPGGPDSELDAFATLMLRHIGTGLNMPYELIFKDFSKTNYSSARAALLEAWRYFYACRQMVSDGWCSVVYDLWFEEAVNRGRIPDCKPADFYSRRLAWTQAKWIYAGRGWVDPLKEAQAAGTRMDNNLSSEEDEAAEQGRDARDIREQRAREMAHEFELEKQYGLPPGSMSRKGNGQIVTVHSSDGESSAKSDQGAKAA